MIKIKCGINPVVKLFRAKHKLALKDKFENNSMCGWDVVVPDWHVVSVDTNIDMSSGIEGGLALECAGAYYNNAKMRKIVNIDEYSELVFEHYIQNPNSNAEPNSLKMYLDGQLKINMQGPSPWQVNEPIGLSPGSHEFVFLYNANSPVGKKAVIDNFVIYESKEVDCLIIKSTPPKPDRNFPTHDILRGFKRIQQTVESNTNISFTAMFEADSFQDFILHADDIYYFKDEFGRVYRGVFSESIEPESIVKGKVYVVNLSMLCQQKAGVGFV